jgi:hypothetical protein
MLRLLVAWLVCSLCVATVASAFVAHNRKNVPTISRIIRVHQATSSQASSSSQTASSSQEPQFDADYYTPPDPSQQSRQRNNNTPGGDGTQTRITLTRFLSNAVKDNPEVRVT